MFFFNFFFFVRSFSKGNTALILFYLLIPRITINKYLRLDAQISPRGKKSDEALKIPFSTWVYDLSSPHLLLAIYIYRIEMFFFVFFHGEALDHVYVLNLILFSLEKILFSFTEYLLWKKSVFLYSKLFYIVVALQFDSNYEKHTKT